MALSIKSPQVEDLVDEVVSLTGETPTEAVNQALAERRERLILGGLKDDRYARFMRLLERDIWPAVPKQELGARRVARDEGAAILGLGPEGV